MIDLIVYYEKLTLLFECQWAIISLLSIEDNWTGIGVTDRSRDALEVTTVAMAYSDAQRRDELLRRLKTAWDKMSSEERSAVEVVVNSITLIHANSSMEKAEYPPLAEKELFERIDLSLAQADHEEYTDADAFEKEVVAEFGLA